MKEDQIDYPLLLPSR